MWRSREAGFTLVEVSVGLLLTSILLAGVFGILATSLDAYIRGDRNIELQQTARYALDLMVRELQYASKITEIKETSITFATEQYAPKKFITYSLMTESGVGILKRDQNDGSSAQPVTGGGTAVKVSVSSLKITQLRPVGAGDPITVGIEITVTDLAVSDTAKRPSYTLRTAVTVINALSH